MMKLIYFSIRFSRWVYCVASITHTRTKFIVLIIVKKRGILLSVDVGGGFLPKVDF